MAIPDIPPRPTYRETLIEMHEEGRIGPVSYQYREVKASPRASTRWEVVASADGLSGSATERTKKRAQRAAASKLVKKLRVCPHPELDQYATAEAATKMRIPKTYPCRCGWHHAA